jgi:hypothetical protein
MLFFLSLDIVDAFGQSLPHFGSLFLDRNDRPFHLPSEVFKLAVRRRLRSKTLKLGNKKVNFFARLAIFVPLSLMFVK